jgi:hypothetical protein
MVRSVTDRALWEALDDEWLCRAEIGAIHNEMLSLLDTLVGRAQRAGTVRPDVGAVDVMILVKGVCEAARSLRHLDSDFGDRQIDLVRAAICAPGHERPLRGRAPTIHDLAAPVPEIAPSGAAL